MGGLFSAKAPAPLPAPARPVTVYYFKTPDIELDDTEVQSEKLSKSRGKKGLRQDVTVDTSTQTGSTSSGLQIPARTRGNVNGWNY